MIKAIPLSDNIFTDFIAWGLGIPLVVISISHEYAKECYHSRDIYEKSYF